VQVDNGKLSIPYSWGIDVWDVILLFEVALFVLVCPYTKVEESFNLQVSEEKIEKGSTCL
tara:strand:- start:540 stop:719 length:180 start_codon:yes stop_codon:yes gene_type:complete